MSKFLLNTTGRETDMLEDEGCFCRGFSPKTRAKLLNQAVNYSF